MKTLKMFQLALVITVLSVLTGCSDQITSSGNPETYKQASKTVKSEVTESETNSAIPVLRNKAVFKTQIRIKPYRSYTFDYGNTGLSKFTDLRVENLNINPNYDTDKCGSLQISGKNNVEKQMLTCENSGLNLNEILVTNLTSEFLDLEVILAGSAFVISPDDK